jgi:hypothetical protein
MNATTLMLAGYGAIVIGRWSHNQPTFLDAPAKTIVQFVFVLLVIAFLDQGQTEPIAKGFATLFLVVALLSNNSPLTGLAKKFSPTTGNTTPPKTINV